MLEILNAAHLFFKITLAAEEGKKEFPFTLGQNQYDFIDYPDFVLKFQQQFVKIVSKVLLISVQDVRKIS